MNQINVVPYIDVMLVLLVIFMVTAPLIQTGSVDLPTVDKVPAAKAEAMIISLKADGEVTLRESAAGTERPVRQAELLATLGAALERNPDQPVVLAADRKLEYAKVMAMLDELRKAGARKLGLQTQTDGNP
jgi:biopolymer transport protein TolR